MVESALMTAGTVTMKALRKSSEMVGGVRTCLRCRATDYNQYGHCRPCLKIRAKVARVEKRYAVKPRAKPDGYWRTDKYRESHTRWRDENRHVYLAKKARHRAAKLNATPPWLDAEDLIDIEGIYAAAQYMKHFTGTPHHVDHVVPLQHELVCGLHVPWNLKVIPADANVRKGNRWDPDEYERGYPNLGRGPEAISDRPPKGSEGPEGMPDRGP